MNWNVLERIEGGLKKIPRCMGCTIVGWSCHLLTRVYWRRSNLSGNFPLTWKDCWFVNTGSVSLLMMSILLFYLSNCIHREASFWLTHFTLVGQLTLKHLSSWDLGHCVRSPGYTGLFFVAKSTFSTSLPCSL